MVDRTIRGMWRKSKSPYFGEYTQPDKNGRCKCNKCGKEFHRREVLKHLRREHPRKIEKRERMN